MNTELTQVNSYQKKVNFQITAEEMAVYKQKAFNKFRQNAAIPGFRKGKAPVHLINERYIGQINQETVDMAINETYMSYLRTNNIYPLSPADIQEVKFVADQPFSYAAIVECQPEFELKSYAGFQAEQLIVKVDENELEKAVKELLNRYASVKVTDAAAENGYVVKYQLKTAGLADEAWQTYETEIGAVENDVMSAILTAHKAGEEFVTDIAFPAEYHLTPLAGMDDKFTVQITEVQEKKLPELTDEFAATIDKKYTSAAELKAEIEKGLSEYKNRQSENMLFSALITQIVDAHDNFEVPPSILDKYLTDLAENAKKQYGFKGIDNGVLKDLYRENAARSMKWEYIKDHIITAEKIEVSEEEVEAKLEDIAKNAGVDLEKVKKYYAADQKQDNLKHDIQEEKLKAILISKNTVVKVDKLTEPAEEINE